MTPPPDPSQLSLPRRALFALAPTALLVGLFALGFLGEPENSPWLNRSPLWGPGDPFYNEDPSQVMNLAHPLLIWRPRPHFSGSSEYARGGVTNLIDLPALFAEAEPRYRGSALIHDWVHPSREGNRVIAEALAEVLRAP